MQVFQQSVLICEAAQSHLHVCVLYAGILSKNGLRVQLLANKGLISTD